MFALAQDRCQYDKRHSIRIFPAARLLAAAPYDLLFGDIPVTPPFNAEDIAVQLDTNFSCTRD